MNPPRITFSHLKNELLSMWNLEKGFPNTTLAIFQNPRRTIDTYLFENRKAYIHPLRYVFVATALSFLITLKSKAYQSFMELSTRSNQAKFDERPELEELFNKTLEIYYSSMQIVLFLSLPLVALITYLLLNKRQFNFWEHIAINAFVFGAIALVTSLVNIPFMLLNTPWPVAVTILLSFVLYIFLYKKIFEHNWIRTVFSFFMAYGFGYILTAIGATILIMFYVASTMARAGHLG